MFTKRTIRPERVITSVDTPSEALAVSIGERGCVDLPFMAELLGTPEVYDHIIEELQGVIFKDPTVEGAETDGWQTADEYLSGNVRKKLELAEAAAEKDARFAVNREALLKVQPKDLDASEIDVQLGATWIDRKYIQQFMHETFETPFYLTRVIDVQYSPITAAWRINGKTKGSRSNVAAYVTYGTDRANAFHILEETLNLKDMRIYDTIEDAEGNNHCTACGMCERACPNASINVLATKNIAGKKVLGRYVYHFASCTQCGLCVEACPFGAIRMNQDFEVATTDPNTLEMILNKKEGQG